MTRPWWDDPAAAPALREDLTPVLMPGGRTAALAALQGRIAGYVPEWRDLGAEDAGVALVRLFGLQLDPVLARLERLPEKALVEFLRAAGLGLAAARPAAAAVVFTPDPRGTDPVEVPPGTRLTSARGDGGRGEVTWETLEALSVPNLALAERQVFDGEAIRSVAAGESFAPLGERPVVGSALYLGFEGPGRPGGRISLLIRPASAGGPPPAADGGAPPPGRPAPQLRWEALTDGGFQTLDIEADTTAGLSTAGIVTLALPDGLATGRPAPLAAGAALYWVRLRLAGGHIEPAPVIEAIEPHAVAASARETMREEFPLLDTSSPGGPRLALAHAPVVPGSLVLEVDEGATAASLFAFEEDEGEGKDAGSGGFRRWQEVATLAGQRPDARVFALDAATGEIRFGDGREGRAPPGGIRSVAVRAYAVTLGAAGNVAAGAIGRLPVRVPGIASVTNPVPAAGGADGEGVASGIARGPAMVKARGRAVSTGDVALLARDAPGADVLRAYAVSGADPAFPGALRPGTVGVFVVPRRHPAEPPGAPPAVSPGTLAAVARHLARSVGPLGARFVAAAPRFEEVRIEAVLATTPGADPVAVERAVRAALDAWLSPEARDWPIGPTLRHADLAHVVLDAHEGVAAVPFLAVTLDGIAHPACADVALRRQSLPWPGRHRLSVESAEAVP